MSLVDGIKCSFSFTENEYESWRCHTSKNIRTWIEVFEDTGEIRKEGDSGTSNWRVERNSKYKWYSIKKSAKFQTYDLIIRETNYEDLKTGSCKKVYRGELSGSLTSNYHGGANWKDLCFDQLQQELDNIENGLQLDLNKIKIDNLEPSITFELPFSVLSFVDKNLISYYGNEPFNRYGKNRKGKALGRYIELTDHTTVKAYDKSEEYSLTQNLMQFELHFKKMGVLNKLEIYHLSDLKDWHKVNRLLEPLVSYFDRILIYDPTICKKDERLTSLQRAMVERGRACEYWQDLKKECSNGTYYNRLKEFKSLSEKYGNSYHYLIKSVFVGKWNQLMREAHSCKLLPSVKTEEMESFTSSVGNKTFQNRSINQEYSEIKKEGVRANNKILLMKKQDKKSELINSKSKKGNKQIAKEKREKQEKQFNSFISLLIITLQKLKAKAA